MSPQALDDVTCGGAGYRADGSWTPEMPDWVIPHAAAAAAAGGPSMTPAFSATAAAAAAAAAGGGGAQQQPPQRSGIWNGMVHPLTGMRIAGVFWYQGEANTDQPETYACRFPAGGSKAVHSHRHHIYVKLS